MSNSRPNVSIQMPQKSVSGAEMRFYIDYSWWQDNHRSLESHITSQLGTSLPLSKTGESVDLISPETGEVRSLSAFEYGIQNYLNQQQSQDVIQRSTIADAVFFVLLAGGNRPMSAKELADMVHRPVETIIKTFSNASRIHLGIRTYFE